MNAAEWAHSMRHVHLHLTCTAERGAAAGVAVAGCTAGLGPASWITSSSAAVHGRRGDEQRQFGLEEGGKTRIPKIYSGAACRRQAVPSPKFC